MMPITIAPVLDMHLAGMREIDRLVRALTGPDGLAGLPRPPAPAGLELIGCALAEVLARVLGPGGRSRPDGVGVELWVETGLAVIAVRFAGAPLPEWLLANWDRGQPPAVPAPRCDPGWRWLTVRESLDSVLQLRGPRGTQLFLEIWL